MAAPKPKQKSLSIKKRVDILKAVDGRAGQHGSKSQIAKEFEITNSTLLTIIKDRQKILTAFEESSFEPGNDCVLRPATFEDVEEGLLIWFKGVRERNAPISGPILQAKVDKIAKELGYTALNCSNGWIHRFECHHNIVQKRVCGESASVCEETVDTWQTVTLPSLLEGYEACKVFNADEIGLFFQTAT